MADPPRFSLFQQNFHTGDNPYLKLDDQFLRRHMKVLLRSDASERIWEVKLDGNRLAGGWEEFAADNKFRDADVLVFRHDGDENFHVSVSSRFSDIEHASPSNVDTEDGYINDDDVESDDDYYDDGADEDDDVEDVGNILAKKNKKPEAGSSSGHSCFVKAHVTRYSLFKDRLDLSRNFTVSFGEHNKTREIDLVNEQGRRWTLVIAKNSSSGVFYIRRGWTSFCSTNGFKLGDLCKFKLVENGERPMLWLCSHESGNDHEEKEEEEEEEEKRPQIDAVKYCSSGGGCSNGKSKSDGVSEGKKKTPSPFLKLELTPNRYKNGQLYLSLPFTTENGINKPGEVTLLNKDGRKWSSNLHMTGDVRRGTEWFYLRRGWREMCEANGVKVNDCFVLELIWEDENPMFKFHSKIENHEKEDKMNCKNRKKRVCEADLLERTVEKTPRVEIEGRRVSRIAEHHDDDEQRGGTRISNRLTITNSRKSQYTQPKSCTVSDQVTNVKRSIVDTLNTVRQLRSELKTRERNLEASLLEIDALGERILGISQILNNKLV